MIDLETPPTTDIVMSAVLKKYKFPFESRPFQKAAIEGLATENRTGWYADPGTGKTYMGTAFALYHKMHCYKHMTCFVIVPPILLRAWHRWLTKQVEGIDPEKVVIYRGSKKQREKIRSKLVGAEFIILSLGILKNDRQYFDEMFADEEIMAVVDEAQIVKNSTSDNYKNVRDFFNGSPLALMTGTPVTTPMDAYAYVKLISPLAYRSLGQFKDVHVGAEDMYGTVTKWNNLDQLHFNLGINAMRAEKDKVLKHLKKPNYIPLYYDLDPRHKKVYDQLMDQQILELESGGKVDALSTSNLFHRAQQIICNWGYFSEFEEVSGKRSAILDLIDAVIDEIGLGPKRKLIIFASYKETNRRMLEYLKPYGVVGAYSKIPKMQQEKNFERFLDDPKCLIFQANPLSAGMGLNPQEVCSDVLFIEEPLTPPLFKQAIGRVDRDGQKRVPNIRIAIAGGTIQVPLHGRLMDKDDLITQVQGDSQTLRGLIQGREAV
ncbi:MAG: DEAD/DEAH box helicase, partial [Sulfitobacter sp.]